MHFRKRLSVEEQRAQKKTTDSHEGEIACMIYEHFRGNGAFEAVQGLSDLFTKGSQNDDVQDFNVRWDQAHLSASETKEMILARLYKSKLQNSVQLQTMALYDQEIVRNTTPFFIAR